VTLWDERYAVDDYLFGEEPNDFLRDQARLLRPGSRVLCIGDGEGRNGVHLASLGHRVVSLDSSATGLRKAEALAVRRGVELETWLVDLAEYVQHPAPPEQWDAVVSIFCHLPPPLRRDVARTLTAQTRPGGVLLYEAYTPAQLALGTGGPKKLELLVTRAQLFADWSDGWELDVRLLERQIVEGSGHNGLSSVVQAIGLQSAPRRGL
jgi:SAM-dependent methyltransferase